MAPHERLSQAIRAAAEADGRPALVAFLTAGFPEPEGFLPALNRVGEVADVVEIGVPFSDPMADGVTIQRASHAALSHGVTLEWIFRQLDDGGYRSEAPLVMMSYLNPLLSFGYERLAERALSTGVSGFIVPDLPLEESDDLRTALHGRGLALIQLVTPATPPGRMEILGEASRGFVYAVTTTGVTGGAGGLPGDVADYLDRVRALVKLPLCAGFGIRRREQVEALAPHVDGLIVGSALVEVLERGEDPGAFLHQLGGRSGG